MSLSSLNSSNSTLLSICVNQSIIDLLSVHSTQLHELSTILQTSAEQIEDLRRAVDTMWLLICAFLVFLMQLGFALLEAGSVRAMNTKNILMQNILDTCISIIAFWIIGFGISQGTLNLGFGDMTQVVTTDKTKFSYFIFLWAFNNAATTIVSGAVTSRIKFGAYLASCVLISGFTFPVVAYWIWSGGWLSVKTPGALQLIDFAGGTAVHIVGGCSGLVGAIIVGPRQGRFTIDAQGKVTDNKEVGHSVVLATIGTFLLWFGWFGFNAGSTAALVDGQYLVAGTAAVNSLIAAGAAGLCMVIYVYSKEQIHDLWELLNGMLCGLVAVTPCCATVEPWGAIIIGIGSIFAYRIGVRLMSFLQIDDVVEAFSVHGMCGIFGTLMCGLLSTQPLIDAAYGQGILHYRIGHQFGIQLLGVTVTIIFSSVMSAILFFSIKYTVGIRVSEADERVGLDFKYHAGYAYPDFNQRVRKAHEQMQLETEIAAQVRKAVAAGRGNRFKQAGTAGQQIPPSLSLHHHHTTASTPIHHINGSHRTSDRNILESSGLQTQEISRSSNLSGPLVIHTGGYQRSQLIELPSIHNSYDDIEPISPSHNRDDYDRHREQNQIRERINRNSNLITHSDNQQHNDITNNAVNNTTIHMTTTIQ